MTTCSQTTLTPLNVSMMLSLFARPNVKALELTARVKLNRFPVMETEELR